MSEDARKAIEIANEVDVSLGVVLDRLSDKHKRFVEASKRASGDVRDAADKLASGLQRVEKAANFDRLERLVDLLERASAAMVVLAELERDGKLDRISRALHQNAGQQ